MSKQQKQVLYILRARGSIHRRSLSWMFYGQRSKGQPLTPAERASFSRTLRRLKEAGLVQEQNYVLSLTQDSHAQAKGYW